MYEGKTFQLAGPAEYTFKEVVEFVADISLRKVMLYDVPASVAELAGTISEYLISPVITKDSIVQFQDNIVLKKNDETKDEKLYTFEDLVIEPKSMDRVAFDYLHRFRKGGHFVLAKGYH
jgi:hypothetical protein